VKFIRNKWRDLLRLRVLSGKRVDTCNDCLMDFKDRINDASAPALVANMILVSDQRRLNLGYLLDPS
jgi:hypothetical protein